MLKELITKNYEKIENELVNCYKKSLELCGRTTYRVYIWSDGEMEVLEEVGYPSGYLKPKDFEERTLEWLADVRATEEDFAVAMEGYDDNERDEAISEAVEWWRENELPRIMEEIEDCAEQVRGIPD